MDIKELREQIDNIDAQIVELFRARMGVSLGVAEYKRERNMAVYDPARERALFARIGEMAGEEMSGYAHSLYKTITELSRTYQHHILDPDPEIKKEIERRLEHSPKMLPKFARVACQGAFKVAFIGSQHSFYNSIAYHINSYVFSRFRGKFLT